MQQGSESGGGGGGGKGGAIYDRFLVYHKKVRGRIITRNLNTPYYCLEYICVLLYTCSVVCIHYIQR